MDGKWECGQGDRVLGVIASATCNITYICISHRLLLSYLSIQTVREPCKLKTWSHVAVSHPLLSGFGWPEALGQLALPPTVVLTKPPGHAISMLWPKSSIPKM
jgi:hypothetical protein